MRELQIKLSKIAEVSSKREFAPEEIFIAFGFEGNLPVINCKKQDKDDFFKEIFLRLGKELYQTICLLLVCFYLRRYLNGDKHGKFARANG